MSVGISSLDLVAELHRRQGEMYAGGSIDQVLELLSPDIIWHVPGKSPIAGNHRGIYRVDTEHRWIREVWLVPLDGDLFDRIWSSRQAAPGSRRS